ncbi:MAG: SRPBCC family protein [Paludibacteraceae bacterium]|nr:SRPBCC family protein [Paludibacteraceae bacterium]
MTTIESTITKSSYSDEKIFSVISDLRNLERLKDKLPQDKVQNVSFDADSCSFDVPPLGQVSLRIIEREPNKTIKFGSDQSPIAFNLWIQLKSVAEDDTRIKVTLKAEINMMIKMMVEKPIKEMLNKMAEMLAALPYDEL